MSNNARVVAGGEMGVAQYLQALAAGIEPDVRMNPILVKPEADDRSQVVVMGEVDRELGARRWRERPGQLWPIAEAALRELLDEYDLVLVEGAGSPAETNLRSTDLANMRSAHAAGAPVILVADIDRGGAFAHLHGTWALVDDADREALKGFVLNKFRGDESLLAPAPDDLAASTGMAFVGVIPWVEHGLPDEDGAAAPPRRPGSSRVAVVRYPTASNLDEFKTLEQVAEVVWATSPDELVDADLVVLPGSKHVAGDRVAALARARPGNRRARRAGDRVLGICGGLELLGGPIDDPAGVDGSATGLGLLPVRTTFRSEKRTERVETAFAPLAEPWHALSRLDVRGYEIRHGDVSPTAHATEATAGGRGFVAGSVLGLTLHGALESPDVLAALVGARPARALESVFDGLADLVEERLDIDALGRLAGVAA